MVIYGLIDSILPVRRFLDRRRVGAVDIADDRVRDLEPVLIGDGGVLGRCRKGRDQHGDNVVKYPRGYDGC